MQFLLSHEHICTATRDSRKLPICFLAATPARRTVNPNENMRRAADGTPKTIEELKAALDRIPNKGAINKARRLQIQKRIFELIREGKNE